MAYEPIFTDLALRKMKQLHLSKSEVLAAFHSTNIESTSIPAATQGIAHLHAKVVGCIYKKNQRGQWIIITCWSRPRP